MKRLSIAIVLFIIALMLAYVLQNHEFSAERPSNELIYFPSGKYINQAALEFRSITADMLWLQAIQYYGTHALTDREFEHLYRLFDVITMLDPRFKQCYVFGSTVIAYDQRAPELGFALLDKGMLNMPDSWEIPFIKGFLYYIYMKDYERAKTWFLFASTKPDAPYYCRQFAAAAMMKKGDYMTSLEMWSHIYSTAQNRYVMERARNNIVTILKKEYNNYYAEHSMNETKNYINAEIKQMRFLPIQLSISIEGDSVRIKTQ